MSSGELCGQRITSQPKSPASPFRNRLITGRLIWFFFYFTLCPRDLHNKPFDTTHSTDFMPIEHTHVYKTSHKLSSKFKPSNYLKLPANTADDLKHTYQHFVSPKVSEGLELHLRKPVFKLAAIIWESHWWEQSPSSQDGRIPPSLTLSPPLHDLERVG